MQKGLTKKVVRFYTTAKFAKGLIEKGKIWADIKQHDYGAFILDSLEGIEQEEFEVLTEEEFAELELEAPYIGLQGYNFHDGTA